MNKQYLNHTNPDLSHLKSHSDKPTLGIDLDGVLCLTRDGFLDEIESRYNIQINRNIYYGSNPTIPHIGKNYGTLIREIVNDDFSVYGNMKPIPGSSEATHKLKDYYNIKIITHRVHDDWLTPEKLDALKSESIQWLNKNNIYFDEFVYPTPENKSDVPADMYIDDRRNNIHDILNEPDNIGILYLKSYNFESIPKGSWLASVENENNIKNMDDKKQWETITDSLIDCLK